MQAPPEREKCTEQVGRIICKNITRVCTAELHERNMSVNGVVHGVEMVFSLQFTSLIHQIFFFL